jgi:hypothetical protein
MNLACKAAENAKRLILMGAFALVAWTVAIQPLAAQSKKIEFDLHPNPGVVACLGTKNGPTPTAHVTVTRGPLNDTLVIRAKNIKPHLAFDMFTVQRSSLSPDPRSTRSMWASGSTIPSRQRTAASTRPIPPRSTASTRPARWR